MYELIGTILKYLGYGAVICLGYYLVMLYLQRSRDKVCRFQTLSNNLAASLQIHINSTNFRSNQFCELYPTTIIQYQKLWPLRFIVSNRTL
jgi:hypothetical protein